MKVTDDGRVTIPADIRERFHLLPGTEVEFVPQGEAVSIRPAQNGGAHDGGKTRFQRWIERAQGSATTRLSTDEMMAMTRGED